MLTTSEIAQFINEYLDHSIYAQCQCVSVNEAAQLLNVEPDTVRAWIKSGKLEATQPGKEYLIQIVKLYRFIESHSTIKTIPITRKIKTA